MTRAQANEVIKRAYEGGYFTIPLPFPDHILNRVRMGVQWDDPIRVQARKDARAKLRALVGARHARNANLVAQDFGAFDANFLFQVPET